MVGAFGLGCYPSLPLALGDNPADASGDAPSPDVNTPPVDGGTDASSDACVSTATDSFNCGACGTVCPAATPVCVAGACTAACPTGSVLCGDICIDPTNDNTYCGATSGCGATGGAPGAACASGQVCSAGVCAATCEGNLTLCNGTTCHDTQTDSSNCGGCGLACSATIVHASTDCVSATCGLVSCNAGYGDCDHNPANGCEMDLTLNTDPRECGSCGNVCSLAHATAGCAGGSCTVASCDDGYADCDGIAANGCETSLLTDSNCRSCGDACSQANTFCHPSFGDCRCDPYSYQVGTTCVVCGPGSTRTTPTTCVCTSSKYLWDPVQNICLCAPGQKCLRQ